ncbi:leucyl aminopeptidase [Cohnella pontilimi]|uniref:Probable cytosol aminopeptidase n=1 Tax=Cohnella pontilimi TaxID=2564100 RepID=A0A4U0F8C7_9BACL|nr:leucyl aminopeptidase [Cohnella pontilimi]TJY40983.1 leucyl aminopeptidase [Cohnella pontilimi]
MLWSGWQIQFSSAEAESSAGERSDFTAEALVVFIDHSAFHEGKPLLHSALDETLRDWSRRGAFDAKPGETAVLPAMGVLPARYVVFTGYHASPWSIKEFRIAAGAAGKALLHLKAESFTFRIPATMGSTEQQGGPRNAGAAAAEGLLLGMYTRNTSASEGRRLPKPSVRFEFESEGYSEEWEEGFLQGIRTADAVCYARELTNLPANRLTPEAFADEGEALARATGLECRIYDEKQAAEAGMGGLLAVGMGSAKPPRMIVLRYRGRPESNDWLGLIGKGVTFDTGGINVKPWQGMEEFISDMGGAAAVFGTMRGLASRKLRVNVVAVVPAAENMPSGSAYKPGDVITTYSGRTVEVLNTDAEGRIILADGLTTAIREGATRLVDVATLTGAVMHALGDVTSGVITNDEPLLQQILQASQRAGEYLWPLPAHPEYKRMLRSEVADLKNHGGTWGGAIAGGLFIGAFAEDRPWVHIDIGGTAWMWSDRDLEPKGGTGVMVRTLLEWLENESSTAQ